MHFILILESLSHRSRFIPKNCGISTGENSTGGISTNKENLGGISTSKISTGANIHQQDIHRRKYPPARNPPAEYPPARTPPARNPPAQISTSKNSTGRISTGGIQKKHRPSDAFFIFRCRSVFIRDLHYDKIADLFYAALLRIDGHFFDLFASFQFFVFS